MTQYAKLISKTKVEFFTDPPNYSNLSDELRKELAEAAGYKKYNPSTPPNGYYSASYRETAKNVYQEWEVIDLELAKTQAKQHFDSLKESALVTMIVEYGEHSYKMDTRAELNLLTMLQMAVESTTWITANDGVVVLTAADLQGLALAAKAHVESIYTQKMTAFAQVDACATTEEVIAIVYPTP